LTEWASHEPAVAPGIWDIRLIYNEGDACKAEGWIKNVSVVAGKLWKAEVIFAAPMQIVLIYGTLGGKDVADNMKVEVFKAGHQTSRTSLLPISGVPERCHCWREATICASPTTMTM